MNRSPLYLTLICIFLLNHRTLGEQTFSIVWDQTYCMDPSRYPNTRYHLPQNSPCPVCVDDTLSLMINNSANDHYENLYRVNTMQNMLDCDATNAVNKDAIFFNSMTNIPIGNSGSGSIFQFVDNTDYYFISTSNGTEKSAMNDTMKTPGTCLQLVFRLASCSGYGSCSTFTSILTDESSPLSCPDSLTTSTSAATTSTRTDPMTTPSPPNPVTDASTTSTTGTIQPTSTVSIQSTSTQTPTVLILPGSSDKIIPEDTGAVVGWSVLLSSVICAISVVTPSGTVFLIVYWKGIIILPFDKHNYSFFTKKTEDNIEMDQHKPSTEPHYENVKIDPIS